MTWIRSVPSAFWVLVTDVLWRPRKWRAFAFADTYPPEAAEAPPYERDQVIRHVTLGVLGETAQKFANLRYRRDDPFAVVAVINERGKLRRWVFARELLHDAAVDGLPSGIADVQFYERDSVTLVMALSSDQGSIALTIPTAECVAFLRDTYAVVPRGEESEHLGLDAALVDLFARNGAR